jgi:hypothetical protein
VHPETETIRRIRQAVSRGKLIEPFRAADVNWACGITDAGTFLPKHRVGNPGMNGKRNTEHFVRIAPGLYRLKEPNPSV